MIALIDVDDEKEIRSEASRAASLLPRTNSSAVFFYADAISFGGQFGLADANLPATIFVEPSKVEDFKVHGAS